MLIGLMSLLVLIPMTNFYIVEVEDVEWQATLKKLNNNERKVLSAFVLKDKEL